ncbi:AcrIIA2 family anti-CRISPR protein [Listeria innocua]|uniref:AcrIIA2 family anti-CRISPR protein n=1 Tax=Listeria innocua TaxID=1642 RepID=A0AB73HAP9_LISIO|nr:AcrIIA2 family anti-CRISPR protein [Listeria innocua]MBC2142830.1 AcrIIA2 family anti-CRISPR protein [Listeria innocua]
MALTTAQRKYYEAMNEFEAVTNKELEQTPEFQQDLLNDSDYLVITKNEAYAVALCTLDDDKLYLDETLVYSTRLDIEDETYYINFVTTNEDDFKLATNEDKEKSDKQEVIIKSELN